MEIYRNIARPPGSGAAGAFVKKKFAEKIAQRSLGAGRPAAGRPALAARLSHPYIRVGWSPTLICITKIPETKKKEGAREIGEALPDFRTGDCR